MTIELSNLPEGCVANVISLTSPRDACRFAVVSTFFRSAADSDSVWEFFLPSNFHDIISQSDSDTQNQLLLLFHQHPRKQLYMRLAESPIVIDAGRKSFFVEKESGKKCFMIAAREISIVWSDTPQYWEWISLPESRFKEVAHLLQVCWLDISVKTEASLLSPKTTYVAYLVFKLTDNNRSLKHIPVETSVGMTDGVKNTKSVYLGTEKDVKKHIRRYRRLVRIPPAAGVAEASSANNGGYSKLRVDGWMEAELGEVFVDGEDNGEFVEVSVMEVNDGHWKQGLIVEGIEFRPKA